ncbi:hypothetical protein [Kribbella solani]|uniref:5-methylcytosine-specific restriction protein A n=1 Tax=Kribbella solani TaxID=236067 RepID=A0A841DJD3_9ACTN|nr:hypothetical protein [Kribbella solani]MBB5977185.1 5-methylcytosine-specific restriction protein A [Kribbella solani]
MLIYSDRSVSGEFGYDYDGWVEDEPLYLYTGEGSVGEQGFKRGNRAIRDHHDAGRSLRLFIADGTLEGSTGKAQRYIGEFEVDRELKYVPGQALDRQGVMRSVIVFRLLPIGEVLRRPEDASEYPDPRHGAAPAVASTMGLEPDLLVNGVALEVVGASEYGVKATSATIAVRREAELMARFQAALESQGHEVGRYSLRPPGEVRKLYTDLYDFTDEVLYEAKASSTREAVRMAIGQLFDYSRHLPNLHANAVLLPSRPSDDLMSLLDSVSIGCTYEENSRFVTVSNAR